MFEPVVRREDLQKPTYLITQVAKPPELRILKVSGPTMGNPVEDDAPPFLCGQSYTLSQKNQCGLVSWHSKANPNDWV